MTLLQDAFSPKANQRSPISATFPVWSHRQNLGLNSACALPLKDSNTAWDSNYSHSGWERVSFSRCDFRWERLQRLGTFDSLSVKMRLEARTSVCYLGRIWRRLEPLERIYVRFPSVDPSSRFPGVPNLGKPYNPLNGHKSAHGPHRRDLTHILCKVSCSLLKSFNFPRLQKR